METSLRLREYQEQGADFLYEHDRAMMLAHVGAGKTATAITAMRDALADGIARYFLVLAPKRVAEEVWPQELRLWAPALSYAVCVGSAAQRQAALAQHAQVTIATYDNLQWLAEQPGLFFDGAVYDELTRLKNPSGKRFKAFEKMLDRIDIRWGLTGSFTSNGLEDVFGQCKVIDTKILGRSKGAFLQQHFYCLSRDYSDWAPMPGALERVMEKVRPYAFVLESKEYKDTLPPLDVIEVPVTTDLAPYRKMKRDLALQFADSAAVAANAGVVTQKLQQIACIAKGTPVLTESGWQAIESITTQRVWDGVEWVSHAGVVHKGQQATTLCHGVRMTYNHLVLTVAGWRTAKEIINGQSCGGLDRHEVRFPDGYAAGGKERKQLRTVAVPLRLRRHRCETKPIPARRREGAPTQLRLLAREHQTRDDQQPTVPYLVEYAGSVLKRFRQRFRQVRRARDNSLQGVERLIRGVLARYASHLPRLAFTGPREQQRTVQQSELPVGYARAAAQQPTGQCFYPRAGGPGDALASRQGPRDAAANAVRQVEPLRMERGAGAIDAGTEEVFDIAHCGPRNRFVVRGVDDRALIVHNCGFVYTDAGAQWLSHHKFDRLQELLDENQRACTIIAYSYKEELAELQRRYPQAITLDAPNAVERWNAGEIELLLVHPKSAGHGLNLQKGPGHTLVFLSLPWSPELFEQTIGRLHRSGQKSAVQVYVFQTAGTIEVQQLQALRAKRALSDTAAEALK